jgi:hypothetical protein
MSAFDSFWYMDTRNFHTINEALMVLLPKSAEVVAIKDYHPISLIHVLGKLFSKVPATGWPLGLTRSSMLVRVLLSRVATF